MVSDEVFRKLGDEGVISALEAVGIKLKCANGELGLDLSNVYRLNANALRALEAFVSRAEEMSLRVVLHRVSVDVYKVLTLVKLTSRFSFVS
jgi:anti-anti-sigma regulatory factor